MHTISAEKNHQLSAPSPSTAERCRWAVPFLAVGATSVVAGGLVAAVTRPTDFDLGPWVAAFLVLVVGVAQICLGAGQAWLAAKRPPQWSICGEFLAWNLGSAATLLGSILEVPALTTVAGVVTIAALVWFVTPVWTSTTGPRWARALYLAVVAILLVSAPIGVLLAWR